MLQPKRTTLSPIMLNEVKITGKRPEAKPKQIDSVSYGYGLNKKNFALKDVKEAVKQNLVKADTSMNSPEVTRGNTDKMEDMQSAILASRYRKAKSK